MFGSKSDPPFLTINPCKAVWQHLNGPHQGMHGAIASIWPQQGQGCLQQVLRQQGIPHLGILQSQIQTPATSSGMWTHLIIDICLADFSLTWCKAFPFPDTLWRYRGSRQIPCTEPCIEPSSFCTMRSGKHARKCVHVQITWRVVCAFLKQRSACSRLCTCLGSHLQAACMQLCTALSEVNISASKGQVPTSKQWVGRS